VALANGGGDMINATKQAREFGLTRSGQTVVSLLVFITDIHSVGLKAAQSLTFATGVLLGSRPGKPGVVETLLGAAQAHADNGAGCGLFRHPPLSPAIEAAGTDEAKAVMAKMREIPVNDFYAKNGTVRADGRLLHDLYFVEVKAPAASSRPWDYYNILATIPGDQAFLPLEEGGCPLVKQR